MAVTALVADEPLPFLIDVLTFTSTAEERARHAGRHRASTRVPCCKHAADAAAKHPPCARIPCDPTCPLRRAVERTQACSLCIIRGAQIARVKLTMCDHKRHVTCYERRPQPGFASWMISTFHLSDVASFLAHHGAWTAQRPTAE